MEDRTFRWLIVGFLVMALFIAGAALFLGVWELSHRPQVSAAHSVGVKPQQIHQVHTTSHTLKDAEKLINIPIAPVTTTTLMRIMIPSLTGEFSWAESVTYVMGIMNENDPDLRRSTLTLTNNLGDPDVGTMDTVAPIIYNLSTDAKVIITVTVKGSDVVTASEVYEYTLPANGFVAGYADQPPPTIPFSLQNVHIPFTLNSSNLAPEIDIRAQIVTGSEYEGWLTAKVTACTDYFHVIVYKTDCNT